jgi:UDP-GlcNAc:undecaprenyl-phosphate GlcNAc-1-phosphate transferase
MTTENGGRMRRWIPVARNYRGEPLGVWLGAAVMAALVAWVGVATLSSWIASGGVVQDRRRLLWMLAGCLLVFAAGLYDDYRPARTRGLVRQLRALVHGTVTSGIVKLIVIVMASLVVVWMIGGRGLRLGLGVLVIAGAANLWNLLDVAPGRALKAFIPAVVALVIAEGGTPYATLGSVALGASVVVLVADVREWAMMGDAGANVLGFVVGLGLFATLSTVGLAVALAIILLLHVLSETVTLSRIVEAVPPLRWIDRLGRPSRGRLREARPTHGAGRLRFLC